MLYLTVSLGKPFKIILFLWEWISSLENSKVCIQASHVVLPIYRVKDYFRLFICFIIQCVKFGIHFESLFKVQVLKNIKRKLANFNVMKGKHFLKYLHEGKMISVALAELVTNKVIFTCNREPQTVSRKLSEVLLH